MTCDLYSGLQGRNLARILPNKSNNKSTGTSLTLNIGRVRLYINNEIVININDQICPKKKKTFNEQFEFHTTLVTY